MTEELWKHGFLISQDLNTLVDSGVISIFLPHGVGHPVGLDVHDPVPSKYSRKTDLSKSQSLRDQYPLKLAYDFKIEKGHVNTVEPGVYFIDYLLEMARNNDNFGVSHLINWEKVDEWKHVGGVRIEDVIAIDWSGKSVILTRK
jgi:Xaa-Pro dipeptidase